MTDPDALQEALRELYADGEPSPPSVAKPKEENSMTEPDFCPECGAMSSGRADRAVFFMLKLIVVVALLSAGAITVATVGRMLTAC